MDTQTRPRLLASANFNTCLLPEVPRDIAFISSILRAKMKGIVNEVYSNMTPALSGHISIFGWFSLCSSLFWELRDNGVVKKLQF